MILEKKESDGGELISPANEDENPSLSILSFKKERCRSFTHDSEALQVNVSDDSETDRARFG